jgi:hypothetical protein
MFQRSHVTSSEEVLGQYDCIQSANCQQEADKMSDWSFLGHSVEKVTRVEVPTLIDHRLSIEPSQAKEISHAVSLRQDEAWLTLPVRCFPKYGHLDVFPFTLRAQRLAERGEMSKGQILGSVCLTQSSFGNTLCVRFLLTCRLPRVDI